jgi:hypothetical protein
MAFWITERHFSFREEATRVSCLKAGVQTVDVFAGKEVETKNHTLYSEMQKEKSSQTPAG